MGWEVGYFAGSPAAVLVSRLTAPYSPVPLAAEVGSVTRGPAAGGAGSIPDVILVGTAADFDRAVALPGDPRFRRLVAVAAGPTTDWLATVRVHGWLPPDAPLPGVRAVLDAAFAHVDLARTASEVGGELARRTRQLADLATVGAGLSGERDSETLLAQILTAAREMTGADAGSLYLAQTGPAGEPQLRFAQVQNDSQPVHLEAALLPVGPGSVAGHVAGTGRAVILHDAYRLPPGAEFSFDATFDQCTGYRTRSMLVVPLRAPRGQEIVGVLELINARPDGGPPFQGAADVEARARPFSGTDLDLAVALASLAAAALQNVRLYDQLRTALRAVEESQRRVVQAERLRALGEMAGGVAHDFNNVLSVVLGRTQLLLQSATDAEARRQLEMIAQVAHDGAQTVRRIQEFTRRRRIRPFERIDPNRVVQDAVEALRPRWSGAAQAQGIAYDVRTRTETVPAVVGDATELRECVMNIVANALDAMPHGGRVILSTGIDRGAVCIEVADAGTGMTDEVRRRVFEPFFTTKAEQGTGLGLSIAYGIINRHRGEIVVHSQPGEGSRFVIRLPAAPPSDPAALAAPGAAATPPAAILVIDDEAPVRGLLVDFLTGRGHRVVACESGEVGLARLAEAPFDLVLVDLAMPGLSGWDVASRIPPGPRRPPVALITGFGDQIDPGEVQGRGVDHVLAKPFDLEELTGLVTRALSYKERAP